jgi:ribosome-binding factor A
MDALLCHEAAFLCMKNIVSKMIPFIHFVTDGFIREEKEIETVRKKIEKKI